MRFGIIVFVFALVGLGASQALAEQWPPASQLPAGGRPFDERAWHATQISFGYWEQEPACDSWNATLATVLFDSEGHNILGTISGPQWIGSGWSPCGIVVVEDTNYVNECITIAHEVGHLLGFDHSTDPHNIMYPTGADGQIYLPGCYLPRAAAKLAACLQVHCSEAKALQERVAVLRAAL